MYLGSANLTGAGLGAKGDDKRNFEIGVWTTSPSLIEAVLEQFNGVLVGYPLTGTVGEVTAVDEDTVTATTEVAGPHGGAPMPLTFEQVDGQWVIADDSVCSIFDMGRLPCS